MNGDFDWLAALLARSIVEAGGPCPRCQRSGDSQRLLCTVLGEEPNYDTCPMCGRRPHVRLRMPDNGRGKREEP